jgi:hypothetical protein
LFDCQAGEDSSKVDAMVISDDDQETTRFQKSNHRARSPSSSPLPRPNHTKNRPCASTSHNPYLRNLYFHPANHHSSQNTQTSSPSYRKGKYFNPGRARKYVGGLKASSVRKDRSQMDARHKDEDQALVSTPSVNKATLN